MIHSDKFQISQRPYAVRLDTYRTEPNPIDPEHKVAYMDAVWFRRRRGATVACIGHLRGFYGYRKGPAPTDPLDFLRGQVDGTYGGTCLGRWDGERYWGAQEPEVMEQHLALLRPMLANYPEIPDGYSGWWRYPSTADRREGRS